ncbi:SusC/RagA family TonB-linked outer membrane protein [Pedobacter sp. SYP-B3415]|uniref:SusC/RagA family TonB-linked outer membrane protein n=1 Tax=Pedobacter sp. SYP-B3415 TaxID=2496641 RepID=UPI00101B9C9F|nr:SusC/RagA family TonB-linked outer membrane protein [Pedobacter sp. SYP-B3415]
MKRKLLQILMGLLFCYAGAFAQQIRVSGKVTSAADKDPMPGVSVRVKGTQNAVQTNGEGNYSILATKSDVLVFSYIGTSAQERTVGNSTVINVQLVSDNTTLDDVTITAYGIERSDKTLGYSTPKVKGDEVTQTGRENFLNGLAGRAPGLTVNQTSGDPGASSQIVLRGGVSITGDNSPLFVVDGVPIDNSVVSQTNMAMAGTNRNQDYTNRGADINPADIESYTILKGPEATALYGNLGASGAIIITTKKAKAGKSSVSYNGSLRVETVNNFPEVQQVYSQGDANGIPNPGSGNFFGPKYAEGLPIYDNINAFFKTGYAQKHNLIVEGGKEGLTYRWSNEYTDNRGTIPTTQYQRYVSSLTGSVAINPKLNLTTRFSYTNAYNKKANKGVQGYLLGLLRFPSRYDVTNWIDDLGNRVLTSTNIYNETDNPFWDVNKNIADDRTNSLLGNANLSYKPAKWLTVTGILGMNLSHTNGLTVYHAQSFLGSGSAATPNGGIVNTYTAFNKRFDMSLTASATHKFGDFNNTYILGVNAADVNNEQNSARGQNMFDQNFYSINNTLPSTQTARLYITRYRNAGALAQAVLGYKSLLFLTLTGRVDAASRLMPNNPYFAYPSASLAFNFSDLENFKNSSWLSSGKLRGSFGLTGKEPYKVYALATRLQPQTNTGGGLAYDLANGGNITLKPEKTESYEFGFDLSMFKSRVGIDFTYYSMKSIDQIILPRTSYGTGSALRMMNGGDVVNKGIEVQLRGTPVKSKSLTWDITMNFSRNRGKVLSIADDLPELYESDTWISGGIRSAVYPGASFLSIGGWKNRRNKNGDLVINPANGLPLLASDADYPIIGDRAPNFLLGTVNSLSYKNFNLSFLFDLRVGGDVYNGTQYELYRRGLSTKTLDREVPRVIKGVLLDGLENSDSPTPNNIVITPATNTNYYTSTTGGIAPEDFIERNINSFRLRDLTLGYNFSPSMLSKAKISSLGVFVTLTDVFLITNYSGTDPDVNAVNPSVGGAGAIGFDLGSLGRPLGVNVGFRLKL